MGSFALQKHIFQPYVMDDIIVMRMKISLIDNLDFFVFFSFYVVPISVARGIVVFHSILYFVYVPSYYM